MKTIIAGSRDITDMALVEAAIKESGFVITEVVSGGARGVDTLGFDWGWKNGIPVKTIPAEWDKHGKSAGILRNKMMAGYADALIAVWDGKSRGTKHMIDTAGSCGLEVYVKRIGGVA